MRCGELAVWLPRLKASLYRKGKITGPTPSLLIRSGKAWLELACDYLTKLVSLRFLHPECAYLQQTAFVERLSKRPAP